MSALQGYTCGICGSFVPFGVHHSCGGTPAYPPVDPIAQNTSALHRLANAIDRLAVALEKRAPS